MRAKRAVHASVLAGLILGSAMESATAGEPATASRAVHPETGLTRIRIEDNERIREVFRYAYKESPSFRDVVAAVELGDHAVYITEGRCPRVDEPACLQLAQGKPKATFIVRINPRQPIMTVGALLAHELYHVAEVLREPDVEDASSLRQLYERIGYRTCAGDSDDCWETIAAKTFQELVWRQLSSHGDSHRSMATSAKARR